MFGGGGGLLRVGTCPVRLCHTVVRLEGFAILGEEVRPQQVFVHATNQLLAAFNRAGDAFVLLYSPFLDVSDIPAHLFCLLVAQFMPYLEVRYKNHEGLLT